MTILLFSICLIFLLIAYILGRFDLTWPSFVLTFGYVISSLFSNINAFIWDADIHFNTVILIIYSIFLFMVIGVVGKKLFCRNVLARNTTALEFCKIEIRKERVKIFIFLQIILLFWLLYYIDFTVNGINNPNAMNLFRAWSTSTSALRDVQFNLLVKSINIFSYTAYIFLYVIVNNFYYDKSKDVLLFSSIMIGLITSLLLGARASVVIFFINTLFFINILYFKKHKKCYRVKCKDILIFIFAFVMSSIMFYLSKLVVGRGSISLLGYIQHISSYAGGSIHSLDCFLLDTEVISDVWGKETFYAINLFLSKFGLFGIEPYTIHLEHRLMENGIFLPNVYTSLRSYLYDFGIMGLTFLVIFFSLVIHISYYKYAHNYSCKFNFGLLVYSTIFHTIFFDFIRGYFYISVFSVGFILQVLFLLLYCKLFLKRIRILWR